MPRTKEYREYYSTIKNQTPLFHNPWWLDIVCGSDQWIGIVSEKSFLEKKALMPISIRKKWGVKIIQKPPLTTYLGPWWPGFEDLNSTQKDKLAMRLWPDLMQHIPKTIYFHQTFRPEVSLALPFHFNDYSLGTRYTFRLNEMNDLEKVYNNFRKDIRKNILKYQTEIDIEESENTELLYSLITNVYNRKNIKTPFKFSLLNSLYHAGVEENCSKILMAYNENNDPIGGMIYFWDYDTVYLLASGLTEEGRKKSVFPKLVWHAIQTAPGYCTQFDFCGSMMESIAIRNMAFRAKAQSFMDLKKSVFGLV